MGREVGPSPKNLDRYTLDQILQWKMDLVHKKFQKKFFFWKIKKLKHRKFREVLKYLRKKKLGSWDALRILNLYGSFVDLKKSIFRTIFFLKGLTVVFKNVWFSGDQNSHIDIDPGNDGKISKKFLDTLYILVDNSSVLIFRKNWKKKFFFIFHENLNFFCIFGPQWLIEDLTKEELNKETPKTKKVFFNLFLINWLPECSQ